MSDMPTTNPPSQTLTERLRRNIRLLKAERRVSDARIAEEVGFSSRQMVADRINGRTPINSFEIERIAAVFEVEPMILMGDSADLMRWIDEHPNYQAPTQEAPSKARSVKKAAPKRARKAAS